MKGVIPILYFGILFSYYFQVGAQEIINNLSFEYSNCIQDQCQKIIDDLSSQPIKALNFKKDNLQYNNCQYGEVSCKFQFYLPFSQNNKAFCDSVCFENQTFVTDEFKNYKQCNDDCFVATYSVIQLSELQRLQLYGECMSKQNGFYGFPIQSTNELIISDINEYQNCIQTVTQCNQYNKDYALNSYQECFDMCSQKSYQTPKFQSHIKITKDCLDEVLGTNDDSSSSDSGMNWSSFALTLGIITIILGCIFMVYRSYRRKLKQRREREYQIKAAADQNIPIVTNFQQTSQIQALQVQSNINQQIPLLQPMDSNQFNLNLINSKINNLSSQQQEIQQTFNFNSQMDGSPARPDITREEKQQMAKSQLVRTKVDSIFQEIERERDKRKQIAARKSAKTDQEIKKFQSQQANQFQLDQNQHLKMLEQLKKNFEDVDNSLKQSLHVEQSAPSQFQYADKHRTFEAQGDKSNTNNNNNNGHISKCDENDKKNQEPDNNFSKNIQDFMNTIGLKAIQESPLSSSYQSETKSKYSIKFDKQTTDLTQKMEMAEAK